LNLDKGTCKCKAGYVIVEGTNYGSVHEGRNPGDFTCEGEDEEEDDCHGSVLSIGTIVAMVLMVFGL